MQQLLLLLLLIRCGVLQPHCCAACSTFGATLLLGICCRLLLMHVIGVILSA
jgi:hypothetical protein